MGGIRPIEISSTPGEVGNVTDLINCRGDFSCLEKGCHVLDAKVGHSAVGQSSSAIYRRFRRHTR
jgi:hypothetical protein